MRPFALWRYVSQIHLIFQKEAAMKGADGVKNACARFKRTIGDRLRAKREDSAGPASTATTAPAATALHTAAGFGHKPILDFLLQCMDVNVRDRHGFTPLHVAAESGHIEIVTALLNAGASQDVWDDLHGMSPLDLAKRSGHRDVERILAQA
jgi:ankyrin repeat protein